MWNGKCKANTILRVGYLVFINAILFVGLSAQSVVTMDSLFSPSLGMTKQYTVLMPKEMRDSVRYPVLYLLHGHDGGSGDWIKRTDVELYVDTLALIVVMPDGENSWYVNAATDSTRRFENYITFDLRREMNAKYPIDTLRQAIAGLSMGGHGALLLGMKHPDLYRFVGSFSGAFMYPRQFNDTSQSVRQGLRTTIERAFGKSYSAHSLNNDVFEVYKRQPADSLPYFYLATGIQDGFKAFIGLHRELTDSLRGRNIRYEYHETVGGHDWKYWGREVRKMLPRMMEVLDR